MKMERENCTRLIVNRKADRIEERIAEKIEYRHEDGKEN